MKTALRKLFSPILNYFESGEETYIYKASHRKILIAVGLLFYLLSFISVAAATVTTELAAVLPFLIFFGIGSVCIIIGSLASDYAVAKIWGNK